MKIILKILFFFGIILFYFCTSSPENKIAREIKKTDYFKTVHISNVQIIDTIFQKNINLSNTLDSSKLINLNRELKRLNQIKDSLRLISKIDSSKIDYIEDIFNDIRHCERKISIIENRQENYQKINYQDQNSICGYKIIIYYKKEIDEFIISRYYKLICPAFILDTDEDKPAPPRIRSLKNK